jgi:hypothetical protein
MKPGRVFSLLPKRRTEPQQAKMSVKQRDCFLTMDISRDLEPEAVE